MCQKVDSPQSFGRTAHLVSFLRFPLADSIMMKCTYLQSQIEMQKSYRNLGFGQTNLKGISTTSFEFSFIPGYIFL